MKKLIVGMFVLALIAGPALAAECCDKAKAEGKTCEKCAKKSEKKEDKKDEKK